MNFATLHPEFVKRFIDVHGLPLYSFIEQHISDWVAQQYVPNYQLKLQGYTTYQLNKAVDDMFRYLLYIFEYRFKRTADGKQARAKIIMGVATDKHHYIEYDATRRWFLSRFLGDFKTHLYKNVINGKLTIKQLIRYYNYWFEYRNISRVFSFTKDEIVELYMKNLTENNYVCVKNDKYIIYKRSANG